MPDHYERATLEEVRAGLFGRPPAAELPAAPAPTAAITHREGSNPGGTLTPDQLFKDWALRIFDTDGYRQLNPVSLSEL